MKEKEGGTKMHCPYCGEIQECKAVAPSTIGLESAQRWGRTDHTDIQWFRRVRKCLECENVFITAELDQDFLEELVQLRSALGDIKLNAEQYLKESMAASKTLQKLAVSLSVLKALSLYQNE
jgi:transcriptional regulator NrdR family protein